MVKFRNEAKLQGESKSKVNLNSWWAVSTWRKSKRKIFSMEEINRMKKEFASCDGSEAAMTLWNK